MTTPANNSQGDGPSHFTVCPLTRREVATPVPIDPQRTYTFELFCNKSSPKSHVGVLAAGGVGLTIGLGCGESKVLGSGYSAVQSYIHLEDATPTPYLCSSGTETVAPVTCKYGKWSATVAIHETP